MEDKNKKREYGRNRYFNISKENKQRLKEYQKITVRLKSLNMLWFMLNKQTDRDTSLIMHD